MLLVLCLNCKGACQQELCSGFTVRGRNGEQSQLKWMSREKMLDHPL